MQQIALERIYRLFELAENELSEKPERSKRYVSLARKIQQRYRVRFPQELKLKYCKKCNAFLKEGKNAQISKQGYMTIIKCAECGFARKTGEKNKQ